MDSRNLPTARPGGTPAPAGNPNATATATPSGVAPRAAPPPGAEAVSGEAATGMAGVAPPAAPRPEDEDPLLGTTVADRYLLLERLGAGGMGAVYRGEHVTLKKRVAVKFLHKEMSSNKELVARFEREAVAAANLDHPNVVAATDFGRLPDGTFFLVMEFVDGRTLRKVLQTEGLLHPTRAVHILRQITAALSRAHSKGIVHRDLKPENVVIADRDGERDMVKVIDFGIARVSGSAFDTSTALTQMGTVFGTPEYMAPEQAMGQQVDARADQYALGVIAFELFTRRRPFHAEDAIDLLRMHVGAPVPPVTSLAPGLPPGVDAAVTRMLAKRPADRFESVAAALEALEVALGSLAPPPLAPQAPTPSPSMAVATSGAAPATAGVGPTFLAPGAAGTNWTGAAVTGPAHTPEQLARRQLRVRVGVGLAVLFALAVVISSLTHGAAGLPGGTTPAGMADARPFVQRLAVYQRQPDVGEALAHSFRGEHERAIELLSARRSRAPRDGFAAYFLGTAYASAGRTGPALRAFADALRDEPELASDPTLAHAVVRALRASSTASQAAAMLSSEPLSHSVPAAEALAAEAINPDSDDARARALPLARQMASLLRPLDAARVNLRAASSCAELSEALRALEAMPSEVARDDARAVRDGDCSMLRLGDGCYDCVESAGRRRHGYEEH